MDKSDIMKIAVLVVVIGFITELFFFGQGQFDFLKGNPQSSNFTGSTIFNGTIRTYEPGLILPANTSQSVLDKLKAQPGYLRATKQGSYIIVNTETRDDVYPLGAFLMQNNVVPDAVANIALPSVLQVDSGSQIINVTTGSGIVSVQAPPYLDSGSEVSVSMQVVASSDGQFLAYGNTNLLVQNVKLPVNATVSSLVYMLYTYEVPWSARNTVKNDSSSQFLPKNIIVFGKPLAVDQIVSKKQLPYITYIDATSAQIDQNFTDMARIQSDFSNTSIVFPSSELIVKTNQSSDLAFNHTLSYVYMVVLPSQLDNYVLPLSNLTITTTTPYEINSTINLTIKGPALGNRIISVTPS